MNASPNKDSINSCSLLISLVTTYKWMKKMKKSKILKETGNLSAKNTPKKTD